MYNMTAPYGIQMKWFAALAGSFCLFIATGASAAQNSRPCVEDAAKLCQGVQPGGGRVAKCLKEHAKELSPACKSNIAKAKRKAREFRQACGQDARKLCRDAKRGGGGIVKCLAQHQDELSPACKEKMAKPMGKK
jgi:hypothetical protein